MKSAARSAEEISRNLISKYWSAGKWETLELEIAHVITAERAELQKLKDDQWRTEQYLEQKPNEFQNMKAELASKEAEISALNKTLKEHEDGVMAIMARKWIDRCKVLEASLLAQAQVILKMRQGVREITLFTTPMGSSFNVWHETIMKMAYQILAINESAAEKRAKNLIHLFEASKALKENQKEIVIGDLGKERAAKCWKEFVEILAALSECEGNKRCKHDDAVCYWVSIENGMKQMVTKAASPNCPFCPTKP